VTTASLAPLLTGTTEDKINWWLDHDTTLQGEVIDPDTLAITDISIVDSAGDAINTTTYPRELITGPLLDWMGVQSIDATIKATISWHQFTDGGRKLKVGAVSREVHCSRVLTNAVTKTYKTTTTSTIGEEVPQGLAQKLYESLATLQYAGRVTIPQSAIRGDLAIGTKVNFIGPNHTYAGCIVQAVEMQPAIGTVSVTVGPLDRLDLPALLSLYQLARQNKWWSLPSLRADGGVS
jgi:hypothetical protein